MTSASPRPRLMYDWWLHLPLRHRRKLAATWRSLALEWSLRLPAPYPVLVAGALAANDKRDPRMPAIWRCIIDQYPDRTIGYAGLAGAFRFMGRHDEARSAFNRALELFPNDAMLLWEFGYLLDERGDYQAALENFERALSLAPDRPEPRVGAATAMRHLFRFNEADALLRTALEQFPKLCFVLCNYAITAEARGDHEECARRWRDVLQRFGDEPVSYAGLGAALSKLGRHDEAESTLQEGLRRFPDDLNLRTNFAWAAVSRADWPESTRRWADVVKRAPNDLTIRAAASEAQMHASLGATDAAIHTAGETVQGEAQAEEPPARKLMNKFESIGENCELGFVQRRFGVEPLGLFRWAGISYNALLDALAHRFEGIGGPEQTELLLNSHNNEYYTQDRRYGMSMHTFILQGSASAESVKGKMCRRLNYLKGKLLEDLSDSQKILVFNASTPLSDQELIRLRDALDVYGRSPILHTAPHPDQAPGSIVAAGDRLWRGGLGRTGFDGKVWDVEYESWKKICTAVAQLCDSSEREYDKTTA